MAIEDGEETLMIYDVTELMDHDDSSTDSDEDQWEDEHLKDPWDTTRIAQEEALIASDPDHLSKCYWQARKTHRRYRFAKRKFGPRRRFRPRKIGHK